MMPLMIEMLYFITTFLALIMICDEHTFCTAILFP